jgi:hypothetical protein
MLSKNGRLTVLPALLIVRKKVRRAGTAHDRSVVVLSTGMDTHETCFELVAGLR